MKKITVIGLARSGEAAAYLALSDGFPVFVSDSGNSEEIQSRAEKLRAEGVEVEIGEHSEKIYSCEMIILSPGVPLTAPVIVEAKKRGIPVISEIEFAFGYERGKVVAITGSNGKSTTATLEAKIFDDAGISTILGGNIGNPYSAHVAKTTADSVTVLELSSFQLEALETFHADVAVLLNLSPDHLDRYETVEDYYAAKYHIFDRQCESDYAALSADQPEIASLGNEISSQPLWFSSSQNISPGAFVSDEMIMRNSEEILPVSELGIPGPHNLANALAAVAATIPFEIPADSIANSLKEFTGIEHRLERFLEHNGILFVNDSKATNPDSLKYALLSFDRPIVLIAGGYDKGSDFAFLQNLFSNSVKAVVFTGATGQKMATQLSKGVLYSCVVPDFEKAVDRAISLAQKGDVVMLSPGCASFDAFRNFEYRGKMFKELVEKIIELK